MPQLCPFSNHVCNEHCARWDDEECCCIDISINLTLQRLVKNVRISNPETVRECPECQCITHVDDLIAYKDGYVCNSCIDTITKKGEE